jgi:hypothetical protein
MIKGCNLIAIKIDTKLHLILSKNSNRMFSVICDSMEENIGNKGMKKLVLIIENNDERYFVNDIFQIDRLIKEQNYDIVKIKMRKCIKII